MFGDRDCCRQSAGTEQSGRVQIVLLSEGDGQRVLAASHLIDRPRQVQYSFFSTKNEPRMVPASLDFWRANLKR
jgi:hypothetical protein